MESKKMVLYVNQEFKEHVDQKETLLMLFGREITNKNILMNILISSGLVRLGLYDEEEDSESVKDKKSSGGTTVGGITGSLVGLRFGLIGGVLGGIAGALIGKAVSDNNDKKKTEAENTILADDIRITVSYSDYVYKKINDFRIVKNILLNTNTTIHRAVLDLIVLGMLCIRDDVQKTFEKKKDELDEDTHALLEKYSSLDFKTEENQTILADIKILLEKKENLKKE